MKCFVIIPLLSTNIELFIIFNYCNVFITDSHVTHCPRAAISFVEKFGDVYTLSRNTSAGSSFSVTSFKLSMVLNTEWESSYE